MPTSLILKVNFFYNFSVQHNYSKFTLAYVYLVKRRAEEMIIYSFYF